MAISNPIISLDNVSFAYNDKDESVKALDNVSLDIDEGEFVCLLGGNGSGKTTLAKLINALFVPLSGKVNVCGLDTSDLQNLFDIRQNVGMVFQNPDDQMVGNFIEDDVAFGPENLCLPSDEIKRRVQTSLKQVGLSGFEKHQTRALSGGQKQRVAIAAALAMHPRILVLDEAGSMLDPRGQAGLLKACKKLNDNGLTILLITHFLEEATIADRVVVMKEGRIAKEGSAKLILQKQVLLRDLNLDAPFAVELSSELISRGAKTDMHLTDSALIEDLRSHDFSAEVADNHIACSEKPTAGAENAVIAKSMVALGVGLTSTVGEKPTSDANSVVDARNDGEKPLITLDNIFYTYLGKRDLKRALKNASRSTSAKTDSVYSQTYEGTNSETDRNTATNRQGNESATKPKWGSRPGSIWTLEDLSLSINEGDFFGIIGHTGSGKSTLLRLLAGLEKPNAGSITINGLDPFSKTDKLEIRESVGIVMQYPEKQLFAKTVYDDCAFGPRNLGLNETEVQDRVVKALRLVGLGEEFYKKSPFQLSGGQQRRVAIAGVLAMKPKILILDEITAGLDPQGSRSLLKLMKRLHDKYDTTIIIVSHNMDSIAHLCNMILVLNRGREFALGSPDEVFSQENELKSIGLSLPSTLKFARELGLKRIQNVPNIEQLTNIILSGMGHSKMAAASGFSSFANEVISVE